MKHLLRLLAALLGTAALTLGLALPAQAARPAPPQPELYSAGWETVGEVGKWPLTADRTTYLRFAQTSCTVGGTVEGDWSLVVGTMPRKSLTVEVARTAAGVDYFHYLASDLPVPFTVTEPGVYPLGHASAPQVPNTPGINNGSTVSVTFEARWSKGGAPYDVWSGGDLRPYRTGIAGLLFACPYGT